MELHLPLIPFPSISLGEVPVGEFQAHFVLCAVPTITADPSSLVAASLAALAGAGVVPARNHLVTKNLFYRHLRIIAI